MLKLYYIHIKLLSLYVCIIFGMPHINVEIHYFIVKPFIYVGGGNIFIPAFFYRMGVSLKSYKDVV